MTSSHTQRVVTQRHSVTQPHTCYTAAARGAPRHDQRRVVWGVYDETTRRGVNTYPACIRIHVLLYSTVVLYMHTGGVGRKSAPPLRLRTEHLHTQIKNTPIDRRTDRPTDRPTDRHTHTFRCKRLLRCQSKHQLFVDLFHGNILGHRWDTSSHHHIIAAPRHPPSHLCNNTDHPIIVD